jgi:hypothetical protein
LPQPIFENSGNDGNLGDGLAKDESCTDMFVWSFKSAAVVFLETKKSSSQVFFLS